MLYKLSYRPQRAQLHQAYGRITPTRVGRSSGQTVSRRSWARTPRVTFVQSEGAREKRLRSKRKARRNVGPLLLPSGTLSARIWHGFRWDSSITRCCETIEPGTDKGFVLPILPIVSAIIILAKILCVGTAILRERGEDPRFEGDKLIYRS